MGQAHRNLVKRGLVEATRTVALEQFSGTPVRGTEPIPVKFQEWGFEIKPRPAQSFQMYTVTDLGTLGGQYSAATGINASGTGGPVKPGFGLSGGVAINIALLLASGNLTHRPAYRVAVR